jgi:hypothetical protein
MTNSGGQEVSKARRSGKGSRSALFWPLRYAMSSGQFLRASPASILRTSSTHT